MDDGPGESVVARDGDGISLAGLNPDPPGETLMGFLLPMCKTSNALQQLVTWFATGLGCVNRPFAAL